MLRDYVPVPPELRCSILVRDSYTCQECGYIGGKKGHDIHVHHIIPYRIGGEHTSKNLISLCPTCHNNRDKEHKSWLRSIDYKSIIESNPPIKTSNDTDIITARAARKVATALKAAGYKTATRENCHNYVINVASYFEPGDTEVRQKLLRLICETAGIQPKQS